MECKGKSCVILLVLFLVAGLAPGGAQRCWAAWGEEGGIPLFSGSAGKVWVPVEEQSGQFGQYAREQNSTLVVDVPDGLGRGRIGLASRKHLLLVPPDGREEGIDFEFDPELTTGLRIVISDGPLNRPGVNALVYWWGSWGSVMGYMTSLDEKQKSLTNAAGWKAGVFTLYVVPGKLTLVSGKGTAMEVPVAWASPGTPLYLTVTGNSYYEDKASVMALRSVKLLPPPPDPALFEAGLDEVLDEFDLRGEKILPFIEVPEVAPVPLSAPDSDSRDSGPAGDAAAFDTGMPDLMAGLAGFFVGEAVADEGCGKSLDGFIDQQRRIEATLGKTSNLSGAMKDLFWDMVGKSSFSPGFLESVRKNLDLAGAGWDYGKAGYQAYEAGSPEGMALAMTQMTLKVMLDSCKTEADLKQLSGVTRNMLASSLKKMSKEQRRKVLEQLAVALGRQKTYAEVLAKSLDYNPGTEAGQIAGGEYKEALFTVTSGVVIAFVPQIGIAKSAVKVAWEGVKATRDWVVDQNVSSLYEAWREEVGQGGMGARDFYIARSLRDGPSMQRTRELMESLGMNVGKDGKKRDISDAEVEKYLEAQFRKWHAMEKEGEKRADVYSKLKDDYEALDPSCKNGLRDRLWPKGLYGATYQYNKYRDPCHYEKIMFEEYAKLQLRIRSELEKWRQKGRKGECDAQRLDYQAGKLACRLLSSGEDAYRSLFAQALNDCKLLPEPKELMVQRYKKRVEDRMTGMRSRNATVMLQHMDRTDLLNCLCNRYSIMGSGCRYHPQASEGCPNSGGPCVQGNWGCSRLPLPTDEKAMAACQIGKRLAEKAVERRLAGDTP
jgi:hypothetical protein